MGKGRVVEIDFDWGELSSTYSAIGKVPSALMGELLLFCNG